MITLGVLLRYAAGAVMAWTVVTAIGTVAHDQLAIVLSAFGH